MLTMTGIPTADILDYIFSGVKIGIATIELNALLYLIKGGWVDVLRSICFFLDSLLVNFIGTFYNYFIQIINGKIFTQETISSIMNRLYVYIGIFVFFKLSIMLVKYISNPELVSDAKAGVNSLIKRVVFGLALILLVPTFFDIAMDLQDAIIADKVIEKVILSEEDYLLAVASKEKMGSLIGMNMLQGFFNLNSSAEPSAVREYKKAVKESDPSVIDDINSGKVLGLGEYNYNYFPVISTALLGYTLYLIVKFCIDVALRGFKLGFLQMMAPIAIVDYITGGSEEGSFKNWLKLCKGTYLMLFVRVISLWFVTFVVNLMQKTGEGSLLYIPKDGEPDYLLRAVIVLALLAFMMELPKLLSEIFGLDLEGDATVKGLMKSVAGGVTKVAGAGLAAGGAALGGMFGAAKGVAKGIANKDHKQVLGALGGNAGGILKAGLGQTSFGGALVGGMSSGYGSSQKGSSEEHAKTKEEEAKAQAKAEKSQDILRDNAKSQAQNNPNASKQEIIESMLTTEINAKLNVADIGELTTQLKGDVKVGTTPEQVVQRVQQVLSSKLDIQPEQTSQIVNQVIGTSEKVTPDHIDQVVNQVIQSSKDSMKPEITQVVNQVMGTVVDTKVSNATQTVNQVSGTQVDTKASDATQTVNQVSGTQVDTKASDATQTVNREINTEISTSLFDDDSKIATRDTNGEIRTNFKDNTLSD